MNSRPQRSRRYLLLTIVVVFLMAALNGWAAESRGGTAFLNLLPVNGADFEAAAASRKLRVRLAALPGARMVNENRMNADLAARGLRLWCADPACAEQAARALSVNRVVYGLMERNRQKVDRLLGREGEKKYLLAEQDNDSYILQLFAFDSISGQLVIRIREEVPRAGIDASLQRAVNRLSVFMAASDRDAAKLQRNDQSDVRPYLSVSICPVGVVPIGSFSSMARGGAGVAATLGLSNLLLPGGEIRLRMAYHFLMGYPADIRAFHMLPLSLSLGYRVYLPRGVSVVPLIAGGFHFHVLSRDASMVQFVGLYQYSNRWYYDPHVAIAFELSWMFKEKWELVILPSYTIFFEQRYTGMYAGLDAGIRYSFK